MSVKSVPLVVGCIIKIVNDACKQICSRQVEQCIEYIDTRVGEMHKLVRIVILNLGTEISLTIETIQIDNLRFHKVKTMNAD